MYRNAVIFHGIAVHKGKDKKIGVCSKKAHT